MYTYNYLKQNPRVLQSLKKDTQLQCMNCEKNYTLNAGEIRHRIKRFPNSNNFCSKKCNDSFYSTRVKIECKQCGLQIYKIPSQIKRTKNDFCSKSCAATYNNKNKKHGTRRSKLEVWLEEQLSKLYPDVKIHYNQKDTIGSELDIYIPSLKLAFELNGIFHYEPIFGEDKLGQIQSNDQNKFQACQQAGISLCIIDVSSLKYFKPQKAQKYLKVIENIISSSQAR